MHQSVYDKALAIFQEGTKKLEVINKAIDRERIQSSIEHKLEERKVKQDLISMMKEKNRLDNESRKGSIAMDKTSLLRREQTFSGLETLRKRNTLKTQRSVDLFPPITCTTANVPRIMRRNLSNESEFYNWVTGLPRLGNRSIIALRHVTSGNGVTTKPAKTNNGVLGTANDDFDERRVSKVSNIVYNVPLFSREERKLMKSNNYTSVNQKRNVLNETRLPRIQPVIDEQRKRNTRHKTSKTL